jgi:hypothetical protein
MEGYFSTGQSLQQRAVVPVEEEEEEEVMYMSGVFVTRRHVEYIILEIDSNI